MTTIPDRDANYAFIEKLRFSKGNFDRLDYWFRAESIPADERCAECHFGETPQQNTRPT